MKKMNLQKLTIPLIFIALMMMFACKNEAKNDHEKNIDVNTEMKSDATVQIIQFHSEHRCMTCNKIESLTKKALENYPYLGFILVKFDDATNEEQAAQFEATGTALFLFNTATGAKKDMTDFAFMNAQDEAKFFEGLQKEIEDFHR